ncbi:hypothetical protein Lqui_2392 [Legionella quinlivanii]|uniref:Uncharacterized protein n=1 Tax=Legionella quinlivanii TaxID=45073 RepID=A0A0W0XSD7_9GAMM|nr:hypothetical protein [Legionella quinlivanii]KTD47466.1 hypothetical protein Lqui_2392 [Legionella quinlivanii]SEG39546.1 hypothetical protein SAMN02746093_02794 [Legionella quinlivanii DSM 21216]STY09954.1 Uncharacterised protein [Legionella quinlivanii]
MSTEMACFVYQDPCYSDYRMASDALVNSFPYSMPSRQLDITAERMDSLAIIKTPVGLNPNALFKNVNPRDAFCSSNKQWILKGRMSIYNPVGIRQFNFV